MADAIRRLRDQRPGSHPGPLPYRRQNPRRLPPWELRLILDMYEDGIPVAFIAEAARVSTSTVYAYLRELRAARYGLAYLIGES